MTTTTKRKNNFLFIGCVFLLIGCIVLSLTLFQNQPIAIEEDLDTDYHTMLYENQTYRYETSIINILVIGIDSHEDKTGQADAMQLYSFNRKTKSISVLSINRDCMTPIHLYDVSHNSLGWKKQHLALSFAYGLNQKNGAMLTCKAVSKMLLGIPIQKFVALDLDQLPKVQNLVDTLQVTVPNDSLVDINPLWTQGNTITLTKENVEDFVRSRDTQSDYSNTKRMERQKVYLDAFYSKFLHDLDANYEDEMKKVIDLFQSVTNNITVQELSSYVQMFQTYTYNMDTSYYEMPGKNRVGDMHDEFIISNEKLKKLIVELFYRKA